MIGMQSGGAGPGSRPADRADRGAGLAREAARRPAAGRGARKGRWCAGGAKSSNVLDRSDDRLLVVVGPCSVHDPEAALEYAGRLAEAGERAERRPADRDARLLREAAHDDRLEGADQRPLPRRLLRRQRRPAHGAHAAARRCSTSACRSAASSSTRSRRSTSPTRSPGGRSAPARPRARSTASSAPASRCRSASRTAPTATSRSRSTRSAPRRRRTPSPASTTTARRRSSTRPATPTAT